MILLPDEYSDMLQCMHEYVMHRAVAAAISPHRVRVQEQMT